MDKGHRPDSTIHSLREEDFFNEFKQALGPVALTRSDDEIKRALYIFDRLADVVFDRWLEKRNAGLLDMDESV